MKKTILASCLGMILAGSAIAQPVSDRAVIPLGVTLVQILRIHVIDGGNIEFVFNDIDDYKTGIANGPFYDSQVVVASSTAWELQFGAEDATLIGTDDPGNTLTLDNVGFAVTNNGANACCLAGDEIDASTGSYGTIDGTGANVEALQQWPQLLFTSGVGIGNSNAGDINDNDFTINWRAGTTEGTMNGDFLIDQNLPLPPTPDRYTTNVFLDINAL